MAGVESHNQETKVRSHHGEEIVHLGGAALSGVAHGIRRVHQVLQKLKIRREAGLHVFGAFIQGFVHQIGIS